MPVILHHDGYPLWLNRIAEGIPQVLRCGVRLLYQTCTTHFAGFDGFDYEDDDLIRLYEYLPTLPGHHEEKVKCWANLEQWIPLLEVCKVLGFIESDGDKNYPHYRIPTATVLGALVLHPKFCADHVN
jgi:hypothetical protein